MSKKRKKDESSSSDDSSSDSESSESDSDESSSDESEPEGKMFEANSVICFTVDRRNSPILPRIYSTLFSIFWMS